MATYMTINGGITMPSVGLGTVSITQKLKLTIYQLVMQIYSTK